jgi:hypothetical protein
VSKKFARRNVKGFLPHTSDPTFLERNEFQSFSLSCFLSHAYACNAAPMMAANEMTEYASLPLFDYALAASGLKWLLRFVNALIDGAPSVGQSRGRVVAAAISRWTAAI